MEDGNTKDTTAGAIAAGFKNLIASIEKMENERNKVEKEEGNKLPLSDAHCLRNGLAAEDLVDSDTENLFKTLDRKAKLLLVKFNDIVDRAMTCISKKSQATVSVGFLTTRVFGKSARTNLNHQIQVHSVLRQVISLEATGYETEHAVHSRLLGCDTFLYDAAKEFWASKKTATDTEWGEAMIELNNKIEQMSLILGKLPTDENDRLVALANVDELLQFEGHKKAADLFYWFCHHMLGYFFVCERLHSLVGGRLNMMQHAPREEMIRHAKEINVLYDLTTSHETAYGLTEAAHQTLKAEHFQFGDLLLNKTELDKLAAKPATRAPTRQANTVGGGGGENLPSVTGGRGGGTMSAGRGRGFASAGGSDAYVTSGRGRGRGGSSATATVGANSAQSTQHVYVHPSHMDKKMKIVGGRRFMFRIGKDEYSCPPKDVNGGFYLSKEGCVFCLYNGERAGAYHKELKCPKRRPTLNHEVDDAYLFLQGQ